MELITELIPLSAPVLGSEKEEVVKLAMNLFNTSNSLTPISVITNIEQLSLMSSELSDETNAAMASVLEEALSSLTVSSPTIDLVKAATDRLSQVVTPQSSPVLKRAVDSLVSAIMFKLRATLAVGGEVSFVTPEHQVIVKRVIPDPSAPAIVFNFNPPAHRSLRSIDDNNVIVTFDTKSFQGISEPSVFAQANAVAYPSNSYESKCDTEMVSPSVSVQLFNLAQNEIPLPPSSWNNPLFHARITPSQALNSTAFKYNCRFFDATSMSWTKDQKVCATRISDPQAGDISPPDVTCSCIQPVPVGVSLDYVQSARTSFSSSFKCANPCGCKATRNPWAPWKTALIILGLFSIVIIASLITVVVTAIIVQHKANIKGTETAM